MPGNTLIWPIDVTYPPRHILIIFAFLRPQPVAVVARLRPEAAVRLRRVIAVHALRFSIPKHQAEELSGPDAAERDDILLAVCIAPERLTCRALVLDRWGNKN